MQSNFDNFDADRELAGIMADLFDNPLGFVLFNYHWGQGDLEHHHGPDLWQIDFLEAWGKDIRQRGFDGSASVLPMRYTTRAGHGVGKSGLVAWIVSFIMSTRPHSRGIVTANSSPQLETKTWAEVAKWHKRGMTGRWFNLYASRGSLRMVHKQHPTTWRTDAIPWRKEMPEAFAGQHAVDATSFYINDEASAIERNIFETQDGGLTDGEPMQFLFGNATRPSGYFYDTHMNPRISKLYRSFKVDSREALIPNKAKLAQDVATYGEDSDYIRVKIRGEFPSQGTDQFIPINAVEASRRREAAPLISSPVIYGVDIGHKGGDETVIYRRRGNDARTLEPVIFLPSADRRDWLMHVAGKIAEMSLVDLPDAIFIDGGGVGAGVPERLEQLGVRNVHPILFGGKSPDSKYRNRGSYMYGKMRDWLMDNGAIPDDDILQTQLVTREYYYDNENRVMLESKDTMREREGTSGGGHASPDRADALALTFAMPVGPREVAKTRAQLRGGRTDDNEDAHYRPSVGV
jgi:hypothetical protein